MPTRDRRIKDGTIAITPDLGRPSGPEIPRDQRVVMRVSTLVGLLDACVSNFDSDGMAGLVSQLHECMPALLGSTEESDFALLVRAARLIAFSGKPQPVATCIKVLLAAAAAHTPRGRTIEAIPLAERALDLATDFNLKAELRRACNFYSVMSTDVGMPARGVEYALGSAVLAHELGDDISVASSFGNMTAALYAMGLYRETISVAMRVIKRFKGNPSCVNSVAVARSNMASAALALQHFSLGADAARESCELMGSPHTSQGVLNRVATETVWLMCAIGLNDEALVQERIREIRGFASAECSPRLRLNLELAEAALETFEGNWSAAVARLSELLEHSRSAPSLYRDNLVLLVKACQAGQDHTGALFYLGELVEFIGKSQIDVVRDNLQIIHERIQTPLQGKDDVRSVVTAIQRAPRAAYHQTAMSDLRVRESMERLAVSAEVREDAGGRRAYRVGRMAGLLAAALGRDLDYCSAIEQAARLHDIGKLGIPDYLLMKPGALSADEFAVMQRHTSIGAQILQQAAHPSFRLAEVIALYHHERWDGGGYPHRLKAGDIPEAARIAAIADVYDALTHARPYKKLWPHTAAVWEIAAGSGSQFDPLMVSKFIVMIDRLHSEHGDALGAYLAEAGDHSNFIRARDTVIDMIRGGEVPVTGQLL